MKPPGLAVVGDGFAGDGVTFGDGVAFGDGFAGDGVAIGGGVAFGALVVGGGVAFGGDGVAFGALVVGGGVAFGGEVGALVVGGGAAVGHGCSLHGCKSVSVGQSAAFARMVRKRICVPPPHVFEQAPNEPHALTLHVQGGFEHGVSSVREPLHGAPPFAASTASVRDRVRLPSPHVTEQLPHAPHTSHAQLVGQAPLLHVVLSLSGPGQAPPQLAGELTLRVREIMPGPHETLHGPKPDHGVY